MQKFLTALKWVPAILGTVAVLYLGYLYVQSVKITIFSNGQQDSLTQAAQLVNKTAIFEYTAKVQTTDSKGVASVVDQAVVCKPKAAETPNK